MSDGVVLRGTGSPPHPGIYAVEVYCGWKLLEWSDEGWSIPGVCRWNADVPAQWVGPFPRRRYEPKPKQEFDL